MVVAFGLFSADEVGHLDFILKSIKLLLDELGSSAYLNTAANNLY